ncbi:Protein of unknown function [Pyronema omphalodes CBS 100304]|uniref:Uncharacterized protein n=1 Tax=Pyronema omphalodes (strain CBS 100304) TaxID=1076935 RepID=U4LL61_PYROM|nr:Protein of unknown function [Pyronema omphalodes CBS 100304]
MDPTVLLLLGLDLGREGGWRLSRGLWSLVSGQNNLLNLYISGWWLNLTGIVAFRTLVLLFCHIGVDRLVYNVKMVSKKHFIPSGSPANGGSSPSSAKPPYHLPGANIGIIVLLFLPIPLSIYGVYYIHKHLRTSRCAAKNAAMNRARYAYGVEVPGAGEVRGRVQRNS